MEIFAPAPTISRPDGRTDLSPTCPQSRTPSARPRTERAARAADIAQQRVAAADRKAEQRRDRDRKEQLRREFNRQGEDRKAAEQKQAAAKQQAQKQAAERKAAAMSQNGRRRGRPAPRPHSMQLYAPVPPMRSARISNGRTPIFWTARSSNFPP